MNNDLISREDLKKKLQYVYSCEYIDSKSKEGIASDIIDEIDNAPTVIPDMEFSKWVTKMIFDNNEVEDFDFELFSELACRKLEKLGLVKKTKSEWVEMKEGGDEK